MHVLVTFAISLSTALLTASIFMSVIESSKHTAWPAGIVVGGIAICIRFMIAFITDIDSQTNK